MTTATKATYEPITIDPIKYMNQFAEWKHPKDVKAQEVCKYNTIATFANTMLVSTIVNIAVACFSNFIVLGIVLTATTGFLFVIASTSAEELSRKLQPLNPEWKSILLRVKLGDLKIPLLLRCFSIPKESSPSAVEGKAQAAPGSDADFPGSPSEFEEKGRSARA